jgi:hypothetical protein
MPSGIPWLDDIVDRAALPEAVDRGAAALVLARMLKRPVAAETLRRWPIPYKLVAGGALYAPDDLIAFARKAYEEAPPRRGSGRSASRRPTNAAPPVQTAPE